MIQTRRKVFHIPNCLLEFERVLHVPNLRNNLLSVLYLTRNKDYCVSIEGSKMFFYCNGGVLFTATVNGNNTALLDGVAEPVCWMYKHLSFGCHSLAQRLCPSQFWRCSAADIQVIGLWAHIKSHTSPYPICEPCIARQAASGCEQNCSITFLHSL
jgi:hypothetical protein